ncbi:MAG: DUF58 domain-containing protein [Saprospiraceae bacterium]|nr:DUF58 domain-containing protein [Saprospiraceae bacterium]
MIQLVKNIYLTTRFFSLFAFFAVVFAASYLADWLFPFAQLLLLLGICLIIVDALLLIKKKNKLSVQRILPKVLSLGDINTVEYTVKSLTSLNLKIIIIDELPEQFQERDFKFTITLDKGCSKQVTYELFPAKRGKYNFGRINIFYESKLALLRKREIHETEETVAVFPSIIQMKKYELKALKSLSHFTGVKKIRQIGHSYEFEQIKKYIIGDDDRSVNWKASSRRGELMVNQYEDERSQQVYSIIDKGRTMKMPFGGLSLLDYSINTSLVISNIALQKHDKAGLLSFSDKIGSVIKADNKTKQLPNIMQSLYNEKENDFDANYELLYNAVRNLITARSLVFLFTNFESIYSLERVLPILRKINKFHLLVVMFFDNYEIKKLSEIECHDVRDIYNKTIAKKYVAEKNRISRELKKHGIQSISSKPEDLSINTINKYLELKSRGMI